MTLEKKQRDDLRVLRGGGVESHRVMEISLFIYSAVVMVMVKDGKLCSRVE